MNIHYKETPYGFEWGAAKVERAFSDKNRGWVTLTIETPLYNNYKSLQIYVTKTGKIRISDTRGEWKSPNIPATCPADDK